MADFRTYGTSIHTADQVARLVGDRVGLAFAKHESDYRGAYHLAQGPNWRIEVQPNAIPGDDGEDDLYAPEHPRVRVLVLTTSTSADPVLERVLACVEGLTDLGSPSPSAAG